MTILPARIVNAAPVSPAPGGLYGAVVWQSDPPPDRMLLHDGIQIRPHNYDGNTAVDTWPQADLGLAMDDVSGPKTGTRPDVSSLNSFESVTVYAYDSTQSGDVRPVSLAEVRTRVEHNLDLLEPGILETAFGDALSSDWPGPLSATSLVDAVGQLEVQIALTGTLGFIHASPYLAAAAAQAQILRGDFPNYTTPMGHRWVFAGGYDDAFGSQTLAATSQIYGWRTEVINTESLVPFSNRMIAVAERSVLLGYEKVIAAATIS